MRGVELARAGMQRILPAALFVLAPVLGALPPSPSLSPGATLTQGPPAICFPLECAGRTLPWGEHGMQAPRDYELTSLVGDLVPLLEGVDPLTRMENLRRAAIIVSPLNSEATPRARQEARRAVLSALRARVVTVAAQPKFDAKKLAVPMFDLGYFQAAMAQIIEPVAKEAWALDGGLGALELKHAQKHLPQQGGVQFGAALGLFDMRGGGLDLSAWKRAAELSAGQPELRANLLTIGKNFLERADYDELEAYLAD